MHTQPQHDPECGRNGKQDMTTQVQHFSFFVLSTATLLWCNMSKLIGFADAGNAQGIHK
jgi:hypothetical protein